MSTFLKRAGVKYSELNVSEYLSWVEAAILDGNDLATREALSQWLLSPLSVEYVGLVPGSTSADQPAKDFDNWGSGNPVPPGADAMMDAPLKGASPQ